MDANVLQEEREFFASHVKEWAAQFSGKFALVHGRELVGTFDTQSAAYAEALKRFGIVPVWIAQVVPQPEQVAQFPALALGLIHANLH